VTPPPLSGANLVADGDSLTAGAGGETPYTDFLPIYLRRSVPGWTITNLGIGGQTMTSMVANAAANVDPLFVAGEPNVVIVWGGSNDIAGGATATTVYNQYVTYCTARRAKGFKCIVATMIDRPSFATQKNALNALLLGDATHFDGVVNYTGTPLGCDGCSTNTTYFLDTIHPTQFSIATIEGPTAAAQTNTLFP
jgi:lysophospholipase L1-like esterase